MQRKCGLGIPNFDRLNGRSGEIHCIAKSAPPQLQTNAASATWPNVNVGKVRLAELGAERSEGSLPALSARMYMPQLSQFWFIAVVRYDWY